MKLTEQEKKSVTHWLEVLHHLVTKYCYDMNRRRQFVYIGPKTPWDLVDHFETKYRRLTLTSLEVVREIRSSLVDLAKKYDKALSQILAKFDVPKVLAPGHGFNSERSQRAENGGRP